MAPRWNPGSVQRLVCAGFFVLVSCLFAGQSESAEHATGPTEKTRAEDIRQLGPSEAGERIDALRTQIAYHDELYFKKAAPVISDSAYDELKRELAALELAFPAAARDGVATPAVGDDRSGYFAVARHRERMLSLNKSYSEAELRAFDARLCRQLGRRELDYVVEPKFDGLAISVTYENGKLTRAVTRGNGTEGDDVTANARMIRSLPPTLRAASTEGAANPMPELIELRGEVYLTLAEFARINRERESAGEAAFATPRNLAAGSLKQLDAAAVAERRLEIVFYGCGACVPAGARPESQLGLLRQLRAWGLPTLEEPRPVQGFAAMWQAVQALGSERGHLKFPVDGAVVKLNATALQESVGATAQAPLWAMAYKFVPERAETRLRSITLQVGRTGVLTPVAELEPVQLGGTTVARASLYNREEIARRDIRVGDFVFVEKAGEIIPAIVGVDQTRRTADVVPYAFPVACPACRSPLVQPPGEVAVSCPNYTCPAQVRKRVEYFASDAGVGISGLGPATVEKLVDRGWVTNVADLYRLRRADLLTMGDNVGKSTDRLLAAIEQSKRAELWRFINGLGIPEVGAVTARELAGHFGGLESLAAVRKEDLLANGRPVIAGVGQSTALAVLAYFAQPTKRAVVTDLVALGVKPRSSVSALATDGILSGKIFVLTGTLPHLTRAEATAKIVAAGGTVAASVTQRTDFVLAGEGGGAKLDAARSLRVPVIDETELLRMLAKD